MATRRGRKRARVEEPTKQQEPEHTEQTTAAAALKATRTTNTSKATAAAAATSTSKETTTTSAATTTTTASVETTTTTTTCRTAWEPPVEIKLEVLDDDEVANELNTPPDDVKPDVLELQQQLLRLQQQQQEHPQQMLAAATPALTATPAALLPPQGKRQVFIISDLAGLALTPLNAKGVVLKNGGSFVNAAGNAGVIGGGLGVAHVGKGVHVATVSTAATPAAPTTSTTTTPTASKFLNDSFEPDEFDLQESDTDEEGYSDIDFDEDDELIEDDDDVDFYDPVWTNQPTAPRMVFRFETPQADVGLEGRPKSIDPIFYFDKVLGNRGEFFKQLAIGSNERAKQLLNANNVGQTYLKQITAEEMQIFFGLCLQMSSLKLNTLADYWNEQAHCGFRGFGSKMSLNRFQMLLRVLNFEQFEAGKVSTTSPTTSTESQDDKKDALAALMPLLNFFNQRMAHIYKCGQRLVLNEPLMYWKGRLHWVRDMSAKFRCNAVLLHFLTEQTGLLLRIIPDVVRKEHKQHVRNSKLLVTQRVAIARELLKGKLGKGHTVVVSKYYGSYALGYELGNNQTYCTGLLDYKRYGNSKQLILTNLPKNSFATKYAASIMMGKYRRREKCIYFYSSDCLAIYIKETSCNNVDPRPKIIKEVDWQLKPPVNVREYMSEYQPTLQRRDIKWDKQLAIYVFNLMVLNAYIMYTMYAQFGRARILELHLKDITKLKSYAEFRQDVIASLLKTNEDKEEEEQQKQQRRTTTEKRAHTNSAESEDDECESTQSSSAVTTAHKKLLEIEHMPMLIPRRKGKVMKKKCRICRKGGMLTFSKLCCEICPGMPGLCETPCFKIFHDQLKKSLKAGERIKMRTFGRSGEKTIYF